MMQKVSSHTEGQIVLGPYGKDTDTIYKGTKEEKIKFGTERMIHLDKKEVNKRLHQFKQLTQFDIEIQ